MKKIRIDAIAFIVILGGLLVANFLNFEKDTVSALENRMLKSKPEFTIEALFNGSYFRDYEDFYSDTFIKRDNMVMASRDIRDALSLGEPGVTLVITHESGENINTGGKTPDPTPAPSAKPTPVQTDNPATQTPVESKNPGSEPTQEATPEPTPSPTPEPTQPPKEFGEEDTVGYYLIIDGKAVQLFKFNREGIDYYTDVLNQYHEVLGEDKTIYSMIAPTAGEFAILRRYSDITDSQNDAMDYLYSRLDPGIIPVNVYDELNKNKDEYIYFRTDHHWTALGAYYGYRAFAESAGFDPVSLERYETVQIEGYLGSSYTKTLNKDLLKNPDTIDLYLPFTEYEYTMYYRYSTVDAEIIDLSYAEGDRDKYLIFMSTGGATWSVIKTDVNNGRKILVMKDSFGNAWVPFLLPHYEEIYVVDARFYNQDVTGLNIPEFMDEYDISELVFMFYMEDVNWTTFMNNVENHLK